MEPDKKIVTPLRPTVENLPISAESAVQVRIANSAANATPLPCVLSIDPAWLRLRGLMPEEVSDSRLGDEYRRIKRPILERVKALRAENAPGAQLLMVASALPGDGKTFTSVNLAQSIARERDFKLLLVDADTAKMRITRILGLADNPGLLDALLDANVDVERLVVPTSVPGLSFLPAGRAHEAATELLFSARMAAVAARLSEHDPARIVLFDSTPLLLSSESRAVANIVGQVVLVVHAGATPQNAVRAAIEHISAEKLTGLVLNHSSSRPVESDRAYDYYR